MANILQYIDKSKTVDARLKTLLANLQYKYQTGIIRTETEYLYELKSLLQEFYSSLTRPSFEFKEAVSTPISDDYNTMIQQAYNDMEYIINDCKSMSEYITTSFSEAELYRNMLKNQINLLQKKINSIGQNIEQNKTSGVIIISELFNNTKQMGNVNSKKACYVNVTDGVLILPVNKRSIEKCDFCKIDESYSNGFLGNTHCVDSLNQDLHFLGSADLHNDLKEIINFNKDTWLEYELFYIPDTVRKECNSYGFEYEEGIAWGVNDNDTVLKLKLVFKFENKRPCSWVSIAPYLSEIKGVKAAIIKECNIITSNNTTYRVGQNKAFDDNVIFTFPTQEIDRVELILEQPSRYLTKVGHYYYTSANTSNLSVFQEYDNTDLYSRVDGDKPSVGLLGCKYVPETKWIKYPDSDTKLPSNGYTTSKLFNLPKSYIDKKANQEIVNAYRYFIGIRNVNLSNYLFKEYGEYISKTITTQEEIQSIVLDVKEYIPGKDNSILKYFISLDDGVNWHEIYPMHRAYDGIYKYYVNNNTIENLITDSSTLKKSKNITVVGEAKKIKVKIEMRRPVDIDHKENSSPIVYSYKLKLEIGGETIEY